jgi:hypothetical protein
MTARVASGREGRFGRLAALLRDADWLTGPRARAYGRLEALAMLICVIGVAAQIGVAAWHDPLGRPQATDFDAFWSGARLAGQGQAASAYREALITKVEGSGAQITGTQYLPYLYPPVFMLLTLPLAALPYLGAMIAFLGAGYAAWVACMMRLLPRGIPALTLLAMPAAIMNAVIGQNGFVSAACFAGGTVLLDRWPILAGAWLGVFAFKPHLAVAVPVVLAASGRWRAFFACGASAVGLLVLSWLVLGSEAWRAFYASLPLSATVLQSGQIGPKLITVYEAVRLLHGGSGFALAVQGVVGLLCLWLAARAARRKPDACGVMALAVTAAMLCTPYAMDYDLVCLAVPMAWLAGRALDTGWRPWEKTVLLAAYLLPLVVRWLGVHAHLSLAPFVLAALFALVVARSLPAEEGVLF